MPEWLVGVIPVLIGVSLAVVVAICELRQRRRLEWPQYDRKELR